MKDEIRFQPARQVGKPDPIAFFETVFKSYRQAEQRAGSTPERTISIAGNTINLRFAGSALVPHLTPALEHLTAASTLNPALTIYLWDSVSTGTPWPDYLQQNYGIPITRDGKKLSNLYTPRGDILGYNDGRIFTHIGDNLFSLLDIKREIAIYWCHDAAQLPLYEKGAPVRTILHWWLHDQGFQLIHSGAVGLNHGGVLLAGKGGTGKSTTALTCLASDLLYASDDYTLIRLDPTPFAFSLYNTAKLRADNVYRIPQLSCDASDNKDRLDNEKVVFFLYKLLPSKIVEGFPIRAILLPQITGGPETTYSPASPQESLQALVLSTMRQLAGAGKSSIKMITQLAQRVPSYHLELGADMSQVPVIVRRIIDAARGSFHGQ